MASAATLPTLGRTLAIVTGASRGFGQACAMQLPLNISGESSLILISRDTKGMATAAETITEDNPSVSVHVVEKDLSVASELTDEWMHELLDSSGSGNKDFETCLLINNAASLGNISKYITDYSASDSHELLSYLEFNVVSPTILTSAFLRCTSTVSAKKIVVNISSLSALQPQESWNMYATGKAARDMTMRVLGIELPEVRVLSYAPGPMKTALTQRGFEESKGQKVKANMLKIVSEETSRIETRVSAQILIDLLRKDEYTNGQHIDAYDVLTPQ